MVNEVKHLIRKFFLFYHARVENILSTEAKPRYNIFQREHDKIKKIYDE